MQGEVDSETRSLSRLAFDGDATAMLFHDPACEGQAESNTRDALRARRFRTIEPIKNVRECCRRDAHSFIFHTQNCVVIFRCHSDLNLPSVPG